MKPFRFRLARILELREAAERDRAAALGRATAAEAEQERRTRASHARLEAVQDQAALPAQSLAAGILRAYAMALEAARVQADGDSRDSDAARAHSRVEAERFTDARQDRQVIERLRDKRRAAWTADAERTEQGAMDEVARRQQGAKDQT
jgi:flagellar export protein FliJ